ncbi:MAG TPA: 50S ribosomal protein L24 [Myxococcota bacterium]|nr:50S ribosomal protein L24 [Myxococcota bacterium]
MHIKSGDMVRVIAGKSKGLTGKVIHIDRAKERVVLEGGPIKKRHLKPEKSRKHPEGGILERPASIHSSNVMLMSEGSTRPFRSGVKIEGSKKLRVARGRAASGEAI